MGELQRLQQEISEAQNQLPNLEKGIQHLRKKISDMEKLKKQKPSTLTDQQRQKIKDGKAFRQKLQEQEQQLKFLVDCVSDLESQLQDVAPVRLPTFFQV